MSVELTPAWEWSNFFAWKNTDTQSETAPLSLRKTIAAPGVELSGINKNSRIQMTDANEMEKNDTNN